MSQELERVTAAYNLIKDGTVPTDETSTPRLRQHQPNITFAMIKSDAFANGVDGKILQHIRACGFVVLKSFRATNLTEDEIDQFYVEHIGRPYYPDLVQSVSGVVMPMLLELPYRYGYQTKSAFQVFRDFIGATNARNAKPGTIRADFGGHVFDENAPMAANAIHGSDSLASVVREFQIMFWSSSVIQSHQFGEYYLSDFDTSYEYP